MDLFESKPPYTLSPLPRWTAVYKDVSPGHQIYAIELQLAGNDYVVARHEQCYFSLDLLFDEVGSAVKKFVESCKVYCSTDFQLLRDCLLYRKVPLLFEDDKEANYFLDSFQKKKLDPVTSCGMLTYMTMSQFKREYYRPIV